MANLLGALCMGDQTLWVCFNQADKIVAALTTQIVNYPSRRLLAIQFLGGMSMQAWADDWLEMLEQYAIDCGCDGIEAVARSGFWKYVKNKGFNRNSVFYLKDLKGKAHGR
jgi:hypothetical protein